MSCEVETAYGCWNYMCNSCQEEWNADRARIATLESALRRCARELERRADEPADCIAEAERLLGPMREWPEEEA